MPTYIIETPDGSTFEVDAPDGATEHEVLARVKAQAAPKGPSRSFWQTVGDFSGDVVDNVLPNWGDELAGSFDAAKAAVTGQPIGEAFERGQAEFKANQAQYDKEHPGLSWVSTLGGMGAGLFLPGGAAARGASMGAKALQGAKIGAAYGALSGAGEGEGLADRLDSAAQSGVAGMALGAASTPALEGVGLAHRFAKGKVPGYSDVSRRLANLYRYGRGRPGQTQQANATEQADRMLAKRMQEGNIITGMGENGPAASPETIAAELERRAAMGVPAMPGDITDTMRGTLSKWSRGVGPGQEMVRKALDARKAQESLRLRQHVIDTMGDITDPLLYAERQAAAAKGRVQPLYDEAYAQTTVLTPQLEAIMATPAFRDALAPAYRNIRNAKQAPEAMGLRMLRDGTIDFEAVRTLSPQGFDQVIRAMRDNAVSAAGTNVRTGQPVHNSNSVHINNLARELKTEIGGQNPALSDAWSLYADAMAQTDALNKGRDIAKLSAHEVNEHARSIPQAAHGSFALGARTALADDASTWGAKHPTGNGAAHLRGALGDPAKQEALGRMTGNDGSVRSLLDRLEAEHQGSILYSETRGNSATSRNQALDADVEGQMAASLPTGWKAMAGRMVQGVADKIGGEQRSAVGGRVAQVLTEQDPAAFRGHLADIAAVGEREAQKVAARHNRATLLTKAAALNIPPRSADGQVLVDVVEPEGGGRAYGQYGRYEDNFDADGNSLQ